MTKKERWLEAARRIGRAREEGDIPFSLCRVLGDMESDGQITRKQQMKMIYHLWQEGIKRSAFDPEEDSWAECKQDSYLPGYVWSPGAWVPRVAFCERMARS